MTSISDIYKFLCELAPLDLQMGFDNSGLQIGRLSNNVSKALLALDVTDEVLQEAVDIGAELIISHHPLIFHAIKSIDGGNIEGQRLLKIAENGIAVISMHTNLDIASGGVNDVLIELLGAKDEAALDSENCGRIGYLDSPTSIADFLQICKSKLNANGLRYYSSGKDVYKLAVMGGSGGDSLEDAYAHGCDTYVTADVKYHQFLRAQELGINLIDADHFCTENPVISVLRDQLAKQFPTTEFIISKKHKQIISFA